MLEEYVDTAMEEGEKKRRRDANSEDTPYPNDWK